MAKPWEKIKIRTDSEEEKDAVSPFIVSASRSTDIPAFYSKWFMERLRRGYLTWTNPFNREKQYVSFANIRLIVFWSKNPKPMMKYLNQLDDLGINYYFQYTLNDYDNVNFEPNVPPLSRRIYTFQELSELVGKDKVIWRYDPLILTDSIDIPTLISRVERVGDELHNYTSKLVFSYADINIYKKVMNNLRRESVSYSEFSHNKMLEFAEKLSILNKKWNLELATCSEEIGLEQLGIKHNKCIDDELIIKLFRNDSVLMDFLGYRKPDQASLFDDAGSAKTPNLKDKGQRKICGCIISKDIGEYDTCSHLCVYCYANTSAKAVSEKIKKHNILNESIS
jgi:DNA repair photolyase